MRTRDHLLENRKDMGTAGTITVNLDFTDPITEIDLLFEASNGATNNLDAPLERCISKIEVVDGGEVLWDLPGDVALAAYTHLNGGIPHAYRDSAPNGTPYQSIPIRFGRGLYDPEYAFNPNAHRNPQLRVTFDEATVRAAGATGFVSDSWNLSVMCKLMEDARAPVGFFSCRDVYQFTSVASGDERVEMPTDRPIRMLILRAYKTGVDMRSSITRYKLSADGGKFIPFDLYARNMVDKFAETFKPIVVPMYSQFDNAAYQQTWVGLDLTGAVHATASGYIISASVYWPGRIRTYPFTDAGVASDDVLGYASVTGWCMHNILLYPFGRLDAPEDWLNANLFRQLDLFLTQGNAGAEVNVGVQQLYTY